MADKLEEQLREVGSKLDAPPSSKDALLKLLKQAALCLSDMDQSPSPSMTESMQPLLTAIVKPELLQHQDRDVKLLVATCICEITRITAPEAPYSDDILKDIFQLIVSTFSGLSDATAGPSFGRIALILETVAKYRSCVVMLDLECDDLIKKMFSTFFAVTRDDHQENVLASMQTIMVVLIEESEEVNDDLLLVILSVLGRNKSDVSKAARKLAINIIEQCAVQLEAGIKQILVSLMSGDNRFTDSQIDYHEVIYDIYCCAPQILSGVVPYLTGELLTDQLDTRLKAVGLVGELFSLPGSTIIETFRPIFLEFLKRLTDRVVEVRMSVLEHVKCCLLSNPIRTEASEMISALCERLLDFDENIRRQVVEVLSNVAIHAPGSVPAETIKLVSDRLRDKSLTVKKCTMERIAEIFRAYCKKSSDSSIISHDYEWVPGKILRCFYDKDFRSDAIEYILSVSLFPSDLLVKDRVTLWVRIFATFDKIELKALEKLLEQKLRLQQEMQRYMSLRSMHQEGDAPEIQKKILFCFRIMSRSFADPAKAEENFLILDQLKDANVWKLLAGLLDVNTSLQQACINRDDLVKILGEKHGLYDFLSSLSVKCSYLLFSKEYVKEFFSEAVLHKCSGNSALIQSSVNILVTLARFGPLLFGGAEEELISLLKDDNEIIKEGALHVLAIAGGTIREQLAVSSSSIDLILERLCLEGSRRQAKYAVLALAAITKDDGLKSLSVLYKKLVGMLEEKRNLPAVLQSLGCIAQTAMSVFETRETEIQEFVKDGILNCKSPEDDAKVCWDDVSETSLLKIYGLKVFVKSHLPIKDVHLRPGIDDLLDILKNLLKDEILQGTESSLVDKAHLRLAAAKAVLRLSKHWDHKIPVDIFHLTLRVVESAFPEARKIFLGKVHQYIKDRLLDPKYACAFLFYPIESDQLGFEEEKQNLVDIIQMHCQSKARQVSLQSDASPLTAFPESILPYVVHSLAHISCPDIDECKDVKAYEPIYRRLYLFLSLLMHKEEEVKSEADTNVKDSISVMTSVFQAIKDSEDIMDMTKSKKSRALSELGLSIVKRLVPKEDDLQMLAFPVTLPSMLYKPYEKKEEQSLANEEKTWLVEDSVMTHFQSLTFETDITQKDPAPTAEEEVRKDSDKEEDDAPLGEMVKQLKAKSPKSGRNKRNKKKKSSSAKGKSTESDFDILKMVRELDVDDVVVSGKLKSSNGHKDAPSQNPKSELEHQKAEKRKSIDVASVPVPKRRRSSTIHTAARLSQSPMKALSRASAEDSNPDFKNKGSFPKKMDRSGDSDFLVSCVRKSRNSVPTKEFKIFDFDGDDSENDAKQSDEENWTSPSLRRKNDKNNGKHIAKPSTESASKRKRKSVSGGQKLAKKDGGIDLEALIGNRIKVWWPMDKEFYAGTIKSYDPLKGKHVILYDDGDIEVLRLDRERWELVDKSRKNIKKLNSSKRAPSKDGSATPKKRSKGGSQQNKSSTKKAKAKRTKKKASKQVLKEPEDDEPSDASVPELAVPSDGEETKSDDSQVEREEEETKTPTKEAESDKEDTSTSGGKNLEDEADKKNSDHSEDDDGEGEPSSKAKDSDNESEKQESGKSGAADEESHSEGEKGEQSEDEGTLEEAGDGDESGSEDTEDANDAEEDETGAKESSSPVAMDVDDEIPDDEPLRKWKDKFGKKAASKRAK